MISIFEQRDQLAALERRRQEIAAKAAAQATPAPVAPAAAVPAGGGAAAAGCAGPGVALKGAEPDIAKRRKGKRGERTGRDTQGDPATDAHEAAEGYRDAMEAEAARKSFEQRGITAGPAESVMPGRAEPGQFSRDYIEAGHAAGSPMSEPPRQNPVPAPYGTGVPVPIAMPGAATIGYVPAHVTQSLSMGSPSER